MSSISNVDRNAQVDIEYKRHKSSIEKLQQEHRKEFEKLKSEQDAFIDRIDKEFTQTKSIEESELERKLIEMRNGHQAIMAVEHKRLQQELDNLRQTSKAQVGELRETQTKQIYDLKKAQQDRVDEARLDFQKEMTKYEG